MSPKDKIMKKYLLPLVMLPFLLFSETDVPLKKKSYFIHSKDNTTTTLFENVRILPNRKYRISCKVTNINPVNGDAQGCVVALDKKGNRITSTWFQFYPWNRKAHPEQSFSHTFFTPPDAAALKIYFQCGKPNHILEVKNLTLKLFPLPADGDLEKERLLSTWYSPLKWIENSHYEPTPHKKWFKPAAFDLPSVLYLPYIRGAYNETYVRRMQECAQRMDIDFTYLPLLGKIKEIGGNRLMGVYASIMAPGIEKYSLRQIPAKLPKALVIQELDFKTDGAPEILELLKKMCKAEKPLVFVDCANIPRQFLGSPVDSGVAGELQFLPVRRKVSRKDLENIASLYGRGKSFSLIFNFKSNVQKFNPLIPEGIDRFREITRHNWVYPWYEYSELFFCRMLKKILVPGTQNKVTGISVSKQSVTVETQGAKGEIELFFPDRFNEVLAVRKYPAPGKVTIPLSELPSGIWNMEFRLLNQKKISDAGAVALNTTSAAASGIIMPRSIPFGRSCQIKVLPKRKFHHAEAAVTGADGRIVLRKILAPGENFSFTPQDPEVCLHLASVKFFDQKNQLTESVKQEFSVISRPVDTEKMHALVWTKLQNSEKYPVYKKLGFEKIICYQTNTDGLQAIRMINSEPVVMNNCSLAWGEDWKAYKSDRPGPRIRTVCFSDKARQKNADAKLDLYLNQKTAARYYDTNFHFYGDEKYLGRDCCFSQWCMREFRKRFPEAQESDCLPGKKHHLDHRIFMNEVFAENFVNGMIKSHKKVFSNHFGGLSGTGNPGTSYNWAMLMKNMNFVSFYSGIQRKMIFDFGGPNIIAGRWRGYTLPVSKDFYINSWFWEDFFTGANLMPLYASRSEMSGFLAVTPTLEKLSSLLKEVRRGLDKLFLSAVEKPEILLYFNQRSVFLNTDTPRYALWQRALTGWHALLRDMAVPYKLIDSDAFTGSEKAKLLIVPGGSVLSDQDFAKLRRFILRGGRVCSETLPGVYDDKSCKRPPELLKKLTQGISVWQQPITDYEIVQLGGVGGEVADVTSGSSKLQHKLRSLMLKELDACRIVPCARVESSSGIQKFPKLKMRYRNGIRLLGVVDLRTERADALAEQKENTVAKEPCRLILAEPGFVYDLRKKTFLGFKKELPFELYPGSGSFYAIHPAMPEPFKVQIAPKFRQGDKISFTLSGKGDLTKRLFYFELTAPDGKIFSGYTKASGNTVTGTFSSAFNDTPGKWKLQVLESASNLKQQLFFDLTPVSR